MKVKPALLLTLFLMLTIAGASYLLFLQLIFPTLIPSYGKTEKFTLNPENNYTYQIPYQAYTRLHLNLQTDNTIKLYTNNEYQGNYTTYNFTIEPNNTLLIRLEATSTVTGKFTGWQEIPAEKQIIAVMIISIGLAGIGLLTYLIKK